MNWNIRKLTLYAAIAVLVFLVGSQVFAEKQRAEVEGESNAFAEKVIALCQTSDPAVAQQLIEAGVCENAHRITVPGVQGIQGETGQPGRDGADGADGADGKTGPPGPPGPPGADGTDGQTVTGQPGADGKTGPAGPQGPPGADGADGADGQPGPAGQDGTDGRTPSQMTCVRENPLGESYNCTVTAYE